MQCNMMSCLFELEERTGKKLTIGTANYDETTTITENDEEMMANERKMTLSYQAQIDKMTSIDINIILVLFTENEWRTTTKQKCE